VRASPGINNMECGGSPPLSEAALAPRS